MQVGGVIRKDMTRPRRYRGCKACLPGEAELARAGGGCVTDWVGQMFDRPSEVLLKQRLAPGDLVSGSHRIKLRQHRMGQCMRADSYVGLACQHLDLVPTETKLRVELAPRHPSPLGKIRNHASQVFFRTRTQAPVDSLK